MTSEVDLGHFEHVQNYEGSIPRIGDGAVLPPELASMLSGDGWRLTPATVATKLSGGWWVPAKHLLYLSTIIATAVHKGNARIIVSLPPRHGKSELLSVWTPVWFLENNPNKRVILTSYGAELAITFGRRVRDTLIEHEAGLNVKLRKNVKRVNEFLTTGRGGMISVGIGGPITGKGADLFLIDDYMKNSKDAESQTIREDHFNWFVSTAYTRLEPNASIVILATRWNIDDIIGRVKKQPDADDWLIVELPGIAQENDPLGREVGEALWQERYGVDQLHSIKNVLGTYFWRALYDQQPIPRGNVVASEEWFPVIDILPHKTRLQKVRYWDLAATAGGGDYTSGTLISEDVETGLFYVEDIRRFQKTPRQVEEMVATIAEMDGHDVKVRIEEEGGASGKSLVEHYIHDVLSQYNVLGRRATGDKFVRAQPFMAAAEAGKIRMLRGSWHRDFLEEIMLFPDGEHDDMVDSTSGAFNELIAKRPKAGTWGREKNPDRPSLGAQQVSGAVWGSGRGRGY